MNLPERRLAVGLVAGILGVCVPASGSGCDGLPDQIPITVSADTMEPSGPAVCRDREVTLAVSPEVDGVLHIHGYDEQIPATTITAGEEIVLTFTADRSGQFPIELHTDGAPQGVDIGIVTVHEP
ncbi:MAG: hypothetical protein ABIO99_07460 [Candidatus Limnocylindria bacterium]